MTQIVTNEKLGRILEAKATIFSLNISMNVNIPAYQSPCNVTFIVLKISTNGPFLRVEALYR